MEEEQKKKIVLIVEDDIPQLMALSDKLTMEGFQVEQAKTGNEAIERFKLVKPDIILLDLIIPEKDGLETLKEIRSAELGDKVRIIIFSNKSSFDYVSKALEYNATEYFVKSDTSLEKIVELVKKN